jgi:hypothetical protein
MRLAQEFFNHCGPVPADDAWTFSERRLLLYLSGTLTYLRHDQRARHARREAHDQYLRHPGGIDPTLLAIDEALSLIHERHLAEACQLTERAYLNTPPDHRTHLLGARARNVIDAVPERLRTTRHARELDSLLALPPTER